jgi:uncharacterized membrane protein
VTEQTPQVESFPITRTGRWWNNLTPAGVFLSLAWILGLLFAIVTPPFQVPDEFQHFYRSYQVSEGRPTAYRQNGQVGGELPASLKTFSQKIWGPKFDPTEKITPAKIWDARNIPLDPQNQQFFMFGNESLHAPTNNLPQAIAIALTREFDLGPFWMFYSARFFNLFCWSLLVYASIRLIPICRWTLVLLALTPMSLAMAASLSADATVNGICFLFVAVALKSAMNDSPMRTGELLAFYICGALVALAKSAYLPLALLFLLVPRQRFSTSAKYWLAFVIFLVLCIATLVGWSFCTYGTQSYSVAGVVPRDQLTYMLHHPGRMIHMEIGMLLALPFITSIIGQLGWHLIRLWPPLTLIYFGVIFWSTQLGGVVTRKLSAWQRLILAVAAAGCWLMICTLIYLTFTTVGGRSINGLQGRYAIPLTAPFFLIFYTARRRSPGQGGAFITAFISAFSIYALAILVRSFYIW